MAHFLCEGSKVIDTAPIELFTTSITSVTRLGEMPILKLMETMVTKTTARPNDAEVLEAIHEAMASFRQVSAEAAGRMTARMAEVVQATVMAPARPQPEWTKAEIKHTLKRFREAGGKPWPDGPLRQDVASCHWHSWPSAAI